MRKTDGDDRSTFDGVARRPIGVAHRDDAHIISTSERPRQMAQRRNAPVVSVRAETGDDQADGGKRNDEEQADVAHGDLPFKLGQALTSSPYDARTRLVCRAGNLG